MNLYHYSIICFTSFCLSSFAQNESEAKVKYDVFSFEKEVTLPGTPEVIFDAVTGDISGWWDHSYV
ncbi:MAG: hypothetical protein U5J96_09120 [Ignavibacteriaceae bacterium]|nr:hypothetical protein [Ignavibacteriaceae bacterium]